MSGNSGWCYELRILLSPDKIHSPRIQRVIRVPGAITFHELHKAIMMAFSWGWNEEEYEFRFDPASLAISTKRPASSSDISEYGDSRTTYLAEIVERPEFQANLSYTYISVPFDKICYKHIIFVVQKIDRETDMDDLCIMVSGIGHAMAEGLTEEGWQSLKRIYQIPWSKRTPIQEKLAQWYQSECPNRHPSQLGLENKGAYEPRLPTEPGTPLGFLRAADGCVVPEEVMDGIYTYSSSEDSETSVEDAYTDTEELMPGERSSKRVGVEAS